MTHSSPSRTARGLQAGEVRAGVRLAETLAPHLLAAHDRRQEPLLLLLGPVLQQRRSEEVAALRADPVRRLGQRMLDVEDELLPRRTAAAAVRLWPGDVEPPSGGQLLLPGEADVPGPVVRRPADTFGLAELADEVIGEPIAQLRAKGVVLRGQLGESHLSGKNSTIS